MVLEQSEVNPVLVQAVVLNPAGRAAVSSFRPSLDQMFQVDLKVWISGECPGGPVPNIWIKNRFWFVKTQRPRTVLDP